MPLAYPILFAAAPPLFVASRSGGQYDASDLAVVVATIVLTTALVVAAVFGVLVRWNRTAGTPSLAAALAMIPIAWLFYYPAAHNAAARIAPAGTPAALFTALGLILTLVAVIWLLCQPPPRLFVVGSFLNLFAVLLLVFIAIPAVLTEARAAQATNDSRLAHELAQPMRVTGAPATGRNTRPPDIYLIVLDGHANNRVMREVFGVDNSAFEDRLRSLGFLVPDDMRSNYVQTYLSLASLLNASHLTQLSGDGGVASTDHSLAAYLVRHNRVARFLKAQGYRYVLVPSAWWAATASSPLADHVVDVRPGFDLAAELYRTELRVAVLRSTLLRFVLPRHDGSMPLATHFFRSVERLAELPADPAPVFAFAHILLPHIPYVVDEQCRPLTQQIADWMEADTPEQRAAYIAQMRCVDTVILDLVDRLLRRSSTPPVILIVGDHGPRFMDIDFYGHPERVSTAFIRERFGAFGAFYLPADGGARFQEPVTLVNVLRHVLRHYFQADLPPAPNDMYVSGQQLYRFYRVAPERYARSDQVNPAAVAPRTAITPSVR